jgi:bifunctional non-homologous end joining protein LigD
VSARRAVGGERLASRIPRDRDESSVRVGRRAVRLTNLGKVFFPQRGLVKGDLLRYYARVSDVALPHLRDRAIVMKRYPNGIEGEHFFMKRTPSPRPEWIQTCAIEHASGNVIDFPRVEDAASLLWMVNLGCIDLHPWYARCDDVDRPDFLNHDLDPTPGAGFDQVREAALVVHRTLAGLGAPSWAKTTGSRGIHIYVPIVRAPIQKEVWQVAKAFALSLESLYPELVTARYRIADRPRNRVLVDYNQNAWGKTLASVYSVRPRPGATVSTPVTWEEIEEGIETEDFDIESVPERVAELGDLWAPLLSHRSRFDLVTLLEGERATRRKPLREGGRAAGR